MFITGNKFFSDLYVKSTLSTEGQAMQENIIKLSIKSYKEESNGDISIGTSVPIIKYEKYKGKLSVLGKELADNVESVRIKPINIRN